MPLTLPLVVLLFALTYLLALTSIAVTLAVRAGGRRDDVTDHFAAPSQSRFTIPVSIVMPVGADASMLPETIQAVMALNYPEFELIVVHDAACSKVVPTLPRWDLQPREFFYRQSIGTRAVRRLYLSQRDERVTVIDKENGGTSDAINCGINVARYRYVCVLEPGIDFDDQALLRLMSAPLRDPGAVIGASNHIERLNTFGRLASARGLMASRLLWQRLGHGLASSSRVCVWRRDVLLEMGGYSATLDPALDLSCRALAAGSGRFVRGADVFGAAPDPSTNTAARAMQRFVAALLALRQLLPGAVNTLGSASLCAFVASELITPMMQLLVVVSLVGGAATGALPDGSAWLAAALLLLSQAAVSSAALLVRGQVPGAPEERELRRLIVAGLCELPFRPFRA